MCVASSALIPEAGGCLSDHHLRTGRFNAGPRAPSTSILHSSEKQPRAELTAVPSRPTKRGVLGVCTALFPTGRLPDFGTEIFVCCV